MLLFSEMILSKPLPLEMHDRVRATARCKHTVQNCRGTYSNVSFLFNVRILCCNGHWKVLPNLQEKILYGTLFQVENWLRGKITIKPFKKDFTVRWLHLHGLKYFLITYLYHKKKIWGRPNNRKKRKQTQ